LDGEQNSRTLVFGVRGLELIDGHQVALVDAGEHLDGLGARQTDRLGVGRPVRRGQQHLVARVEDRGEGLVDGLLAAVGHEHRRGGDLVARVPLRLERDCLAQRGETGRRGVAVVGGVLRRGDRGIDDVGRRREVGLACTEADDGPAGGLEGLGLGVDGQRRRLGDRG